MHDLRESRALRLPATASGWLHYWRNLSENEKLRLTQAKFKLGHALTPLVVKDQPNQEIVDRKGWNEFVHALWMVFDKSSKAKLEKLDPRLTRADDDRGQLDHRQFAEFKDDPGASNLARVAPEEIADPEESQLMEQFGFDLTTARSVLAWHEDRFQRRVAVEIRDYISNLISFIVKSVNPKIAVGGLMFAFRLAQTNGFPTQTAYAKFLNVSRSAISKATKRVTRELGIPESQWAVHMKSAQACQKLSEAQKSDHFTKRTFTIAKKRKAT